MLKFTTVFIVLPPASSSMAAQVPDDSGGFWIDAKTDEFKQVRDG